MPDFDAIATAVAARYAAVAGPGGVLVRSATARPPNTLTALPAVVVFPDSGALEVGNGTRTGVHDFKVQFFLGAPKSLTRDWAKLTAWLTVLVDRHLAAIQLGGTVTVVRTRTWKIGILTYGATDYSGIELGVRVITDEPWTPTA